MRELTSHEIEAVFGGGRTCRDETTTDDPRIIGQVTAALRAQFEADVSLFLRMDDFSRQDFIALIPQADDLADWSAVEELYDQVLEELGGVN